MGKGKRLKQQRELESLNKVFTQANAESRLPAFDEATFLAEYEASGFAYDVFRKWTYIKARKDPKVVDPAIEHGIVKTLKEMNITVEHDGKMVQH